METQKQEENLDCAPQQHRHVFNVDFAFIAISAVALQTYAMTYYYLFIG